MIYILQASLIESEGAQPSAPYQFFLFDSQSKIDAKAMCLTPNAYQEFNQSNKTDLRLVNRMGSIVVDMNNRTYPTETMPLLVTQFSEDMGSQFMDLTAQVIDYISNPETQRGMYLQYLDTNITLPNEDMKVSEIVYRCAESLQFYESLTPDTQLALPSECYEYIDEGTRNIMMGNSDTSNGQQANYDIPASENIFQFQRDFDQPFSFRLPSIRSIHESDIQVNPMDLIKVTAPYRSVSSGGVYKYHPIWHTPYHFYYNSGQQKPADWVYGSHSADGKPIQPYEKDMFNKLVHLIYGDTQYCAYNMICNIFFSTRIGTALADICTSTAQPTLISRLNILNNELSGSGITCPLQLSDFKDKNGVQYSELTQDVNGTGIVYTPVDNAAVVRSKLTIPNGFIQEQVNNYLDLMNNSEDSIRVISGKHPVFLIELDTQLVKDTTQRFIDSGIISSELYNYLCDLCNQAYNVNWGHTGYAESISELYNAKQLDPNTATSDGSLSIPNSMGEYVRYHLTGDSSIPDSKNNFMFSDSEPDGYLAEMGLMEDNDDDDYFGDIPYYLCADTLNKLSDYTWAEISDPSSAPSSFVPPVGIGAKIEGWRQVKGNNNLLSFISESYRHTKNPKTILEIFFQLMRWGAGNRPAAIKPVEFGTTTNVFYLDKGIEDINSASLDDSLINLIGRCKYRLGRPIVCGALPFTQAQILNPIVGFELLVEYNISNTGNPNSGSNMVKSLTASWDNLYDLLHSEDSESVFEFKNNSEQMQYNISSVVPLNIAIKEGAELYISPSNQEDAEKYSMQATDLSDLSLLLVPSTFGSDNYIKYTTNLRLGKESDLMPAETRKFSIAHKYTNNIINFMMKYRGELETVNTISTLIGMIEKYHQSNSQSQTGSQGVSKMNIFSNNSNAHQYDTRELPNSGACYRLIVDYNGQSPWDKMTFTNPKLEQFNQTACKGNIVGMLILNDGNTVSVFDQPVALFCRNENIDLTGLEVTPNTNKPRILYFSEHNAKNKQGEPVKVGGQLKTVFDNIMAGNSQQINKLPVIIHSTASPKQS